METNCGTNQELLTMQTLNAQVVFSYKPMKVYPLI